MGTGVVRIRYGDNLLGSGFGVEGVNLIVVSGVVSNILPVVKFDSVVLAVYEDKVVVSVWFSR